jgi:RNA polymerase sigma-70 factor, ECF subfamily
MSFVETLELERAGTDIVEIPDTAGRQKPSTVAEDIPVDGLAEVPEFTPDRRITILQSESDASWVEAAKQAAFAEIVQEFEGPLQGFVTNMIGAARAEDVVQDTFVRAYRSIGTFEQRHENGLSQWLYTIARRLALNVVRDRKSDALAHSVRQTETGGPELSMVARQTSRIGIPGERLETREALSILDRLSPIHRSLLVMSMEGLSLEQIAEEEGISVGAVKSRMWRGRVAARRILERVDKVPKLALAAEAREAMV